MAIVLSKKYNKIDKRFLDLLNVQLDLMFLLNYPSSILSFLQIKVKDLLGLYFYRKNIAFIPVVPFSFLGIEELMTKVGDRPKAKASFNPEFIYNKISIPQEPYFIVDVDLGRKYVGKNIFEAQENIENDLKSPFTIEEGLAFCVCSQILSKYHIDCLNSKYYVQENIISLNNLLKVYWRPVNIYNPLACVPSCRIRI